jgi:hypothetical protein
MGDLPAERHDQGHGREGLAHAIWRGRLGLPASNRERRSTLPSWR